MFEILPASSAHTEATPANAMLSLLVHTGLIVAAVLLTARAATGPATAGPVDQMIYLPVLPSLPSHRGPMPPATGGELPAPPVDASLPLPVGVPVGLPPSTGVRTMTIGPNGGTATGIGPATWLGDPAPTGAWAATEVDDPVRVLEAGRLRYPSVLERAGITGSVLLDFVVDTLGRVERSSVRVVSSSHAGFEAAAVEAVLLTRYRAARARGGAVRQLVRQQLNFVGSGSR